MYQDIGRLITVTEPTKQTDKFNLEFSSLNDLRDCFPVCSKPVYLRICQSLEHHVTVVTDGDGGRGGGTVVRADSFHEISHM
jgi:hypothetical protein